MAGQNRNRTWRHYTVYILGVVSFTFGWLCSDTIIDRFTNRNTVISHSVHIGHGSISTGSGVVEIDIDLKNLSIRDQSCTFWRCFNPYRCNYYGDYRLTVYIYPWQTYVGVKNKSKYLIPKPSREFVELLDGIRKSDYHEPDPTRACIFVPSIDTLNEERLDLDSVGAVLSSLKWWNSGENHLLFNMLPGHFPKYFSSLGIASGRAIVAGGGYSSRTYRRTFDMSIPLYRPTMTKQESRTERNQSWLLISTMPFPSLEQIKILQQLERTYSKEVLFLASCVSTKFDPKHRCRWKKSSGKNEVFKYPEILKTAKYCLILEGKRLGQIELSDALEHGCVPVLAIDEYVLPFGEVLDWKRAAVLIYRHQLPQLMEILKKDISSKRYESMLSQGAWFWKAHFSSLENIAMTTLRIIQDRAFPHQTRSYSEWNDNKKAIFQFQPFQMYRIAPNDGFTAVILTYDRVSILFQQLQQLARVQSLVKIIVVWNNQRKLPPAEHEWPKLSKPLKIIQTSENRLTNRFVPYSEIETEAVLSLDDDILMLNADELEFGYQAWREFPSFLVGYPSRVHVLDPGNQQWTYESEWTNNASLILTGAAFYHNYYNLLFTESLPSRVKNWIDDIMNCEDITMNFLIANFTGLPALKVTPRKKFKANGYTGQDLSADSEHLKQRSICMNLLSRYFGGMVLKTVEFRLDPLLYKVDTIPDDVKLYPDVGPL